MLVAQMMSREMVTVPPQMPVQEVTRLLAQQHVTALPVVDSDGLFVGLITEEDLIVRHANLHLPLYLNVLDGFFPFRGEHQFQEEMRRVLAATARELMNPKPVTVTPATDVADAASLMIERHANPLPVIDGARLVGLIGRRDIIRLMVLEEQQSDEPAAR